MVIINLPKSNEDKEAAVAAMFGGGRAVVVSSKSADDGSKSTDVGSKSTDDGSMPPVVARAGMAYGPQVSPRPAIWAQLG